MNNRIAIGLLTKPAHLLESAENITIKTIGNNITANKNQLLRNFVHNTEANYFMLYNTNSELRQFTYNELYSKAETYVNAIDETGINFFTGIITPKTTIDYGPVKVNIGTGDQQKIVFEVITREAINAVGYLDVRLQDSLCAQDYAIRLGNTRYYPTRGSKMMPWLFDIEHNIKNVAKQTLENYTSGWYMYKHETYPWDQFGDDINNLKPQLKEIKNGIKS